MPTICEHNTNLSPVNMTIELLHRAIPKQWDRNDLTACMPLSEQNCLVLGSTGNTLPATRGQSLFKGMNCTFI